MWIRDLLAWAHAELQRLEECVHNMSEILTCEKIELVMLVFYLWVKDEKGISVIKTIKV